MLATLGALLLLAGCAGSPAPGAAPDEEPPVTDPDAPVVAFYGDSYTLGTGASTASKRWSSIICADRGWTEVNPSVNGLGFVNNRTPLTDLPGAIIEQDAAIVFVAMGLNDNFSYGYVPDDRIRGAIADDFARLATGLPDARFIVVEPFWYTDARPASVEAIIGWVHEAADTIGADWIPGASHWIEGHREWMAPDGLHPNDDGYAEMARQMDAALAELGL